MFFFFRFQGAIFKNIEDDNKRFGTATKYQMSHGPHGDEALYAYFDDDPISPLSEP